MTPTHLWNLRRSRSIDLIPGPLYRRIGWRVRLSVTLAKRITWEEHEARRSEFWRDYYEGQE